MEPIGGYFSLELPKCDLYHPRAIALNTGRNCLEYILRVRKYKKVFIPYYTCDVLMEPFLKLGVSYEFYHINIDLEITDEPRLNNGEALLYTNYFGLKQHAVGRLAEQYGQQLIIDNTQAFYAKPIDGIDTFYSCRKFFGVPDGAYLYIDKELDEEFGQDLSWDRMISLNKRVDLGAEAGYADYKELRSSLIGQPIKRMSKLTSRLLSSIDYKAVAQCRRTNYFFLHNCLSTSNMLKLEVDEEAVPMVYPYLVQKEGLREKLISNKVFVARYWPNVLEWIKSDTLEYLLALNTQHLPIDQRYGEQDMLRIVNCINE